MPRLNGTDEQMMFSEVVRLPEFDRDMEKRLKKHNTLEEDVSIAIKSALYPHHKLKQPYSGIYPVSYLKIGENNYYKLTEMACKSLHGTGKRSGYRLIYAYYAETDTIEFIEIYYKPDKANENRKRILNHHKRGNH